MEGQPEDTTDEQIVQSDWLRRREDSKDAAALRDLRVRARAIASRIIAKVDTEDRLPDAVEQEEAADRAELAQLCGTLAAMDVAIETTEPGAWTQSRHQAVTTILALRSDENVEAIIVNGKRMSIDTDAALGQLGDFRKSGRVIDNEDEGEDDEEAPEEDS